MAFKETGEVCALLEGAAKAIEQVRSNNQLDFSDLFAVSPLVDLGKDALKDADKIISEFRESSGEELDAAISRLIKATVFFSSEVVALFKMVIK